MKGVEFTITFLSKSGRSRIYYHLVNRKMEEVEVTIIFIVQKSERVEFPMNV